MMFAFSPVLAGRTCVVQYSDTLLPGAWHELTGYGDWLLVKADFLVPRLDYA